MKYTTAFILFILVLASCQSNRQDTAPESTDIELRPDFATHFEQCKTGGAIVIYDYQQRKWIVSDSVEVKVERLPASTFKIVNSLILLETGAIRDEDEILHWPGKTDTLKYGYRPEIYHDMTLREAFQQSAVWAFLDRSEKVPRDTYRKYFAESGYGNADLSQADPDFWNFGTFGVSQINMVEFLIRLYENRLPFSKEHMDLVKDIMLTEQTDDYTIRAKTGWTRENGINLGWWVGYIESPRGTYFFATRLLQDRKNKTENFGPCRKEITKAVLRDLGIINSGS